MAEIFLDKRYLDTNVGFFFPNRLELTGLSVLEQPRVERVSIDESPIARQPLSAAEALDIRANKPHHVWVRIKFTTRACKLVFYARLSCTPRYACYVRFLSAAGKPGHYSFLLEGQDLKSAACFVVIDGPPGAALGGLVPSLGTADDMSAHAESEAGTEVGDAEVMDNEMRALIAEEEELTGRPEFDPDENNADDTYEPDEREGEIENETHHPPDDVEIALVHEMIRTTIQRSQEEDELEHVISDVEAAGVGDAHDSEIENSAHSILFSFRGCVAPSTPARYPLACTPDAAADILGAFAHRYLWYTRTFR
jgi:hypothetical protein